MEYFAAWKIHRKLLHRNQVEHVLEKIYERHTHSDGDGDGVLSPAVRRVTDSFLKKTKEMEFVKRSSEAMGITKAEFSTQLMRDSADASRS